MDRLLAALELQTCVKVDMSLAFVELPFQWRPRKTWPDKERREGQRGEHVQSPGLEGTSGVLGLREGSSLCLQLKEQAVEMLMPAARMLVKGEKSLFSLHYWVGLFCF